MIYTHIANDGSIFYTVTPFGSALAVLFGDGPPVCVLSDETGSLALKSQAARCES